VPVIAQYHRFHAAVSKPLGDSIHRLAVSEDRVGPVWNCGYVPRSLRDSMRGFACHVLSRRSRDVARERVDEARRLLRSIEGEVTEEDARGGCHKS
jgi:hypothetical protein